MNTTNGREGGDGESRQRGSLHMDENHLAYTRAVRRMNALP